MKSIKTYLLVALASLAIMTSATRAETKEGQIRAALLFQFARLTTFPDSAFTASDGPMVIGLLGDAEFSDMLTKGVTGKKIGTHIVAVKNIASAAEIKGCQVVYVAPGQDAAAAIAAAAGLPVVLVGEDDSFLGNGGIMRFVIDDNKVRFQVSTANAAKVGLKFGDKLLGLAKP